MSSLLYKVFLKKTNLDSLVTVGGQESDPYFEEVPEKDRWFYQKKGAKRRRRSPDFIPKHDLKILDSVKRKAWRLDMAGSLCGVRIGWAAIIGLLPWIGDIIAAYFAYGLIQKAQQIDGGLPASVYAKMKANLLFDFSVGLIPIVGDFINVLYKCNSRNFILLEKHLVDKYAKGGGVQPAQGQPRDLV